MTAAMAPKLDLAGYSSAVQRAGGINAYGTVARVVGLTIEVSGLAASIGDLCRIFTTERGPGVDAEVVGFRDGTLLLMPFGELHGISGGCAVISAGSVLSVPVGQGLLGRVLDGLARPMDGLGMLKASERYPVNAHPPAPLARRRIYDPVETGIRAIDGLLTVGKGQRIGIFSGSGVGKSTLLGMIARNCRADVNVIALIGERGREVREFLERDLGDEGLKRSVVVVSTSDQAALMRIKGAYVATAMAEFFRDQGLDVMLLMDSITRFATAQREIGLATGEPPASKGYTPSVFAILPKLLERAGSSDRGSITAFYTVLVEGDDLTEPVTDISRSILDGHIVLDRAIAARQQYPAIDIRESVSRAMPDVTERAHFTAAAEFKEAYATYESARDLIDIGAYEPGSNSRTDRAVRMYDRMVGYLKQHMTESFGAVEALEQLLLLFPPGSPSAAGGGEGQLSVASAARSLGPVLYYDPDRPVITMAQNAAGPPGSAAADAPPVPDEAGPSSDNKSR